MLTIGLRRNELGIERDITGSPSELVHNRLGGLYSARCVLFSLKSPRSRRFRQKAVGMKPGRYWRGRHNRLKLPVRISCCCAPTQCTRSPTKSKPRWTYRYYTSPTLPPPQRKQPDRDRRLIGY